MAKILKFSRSPDLRRDLSFHFFKSPVYGAFQIWDTGRGRWGWGEALFNVKHYIWRRTGRFSTVIWLNELVASLYGFAKT